MTAQTGPQFGQDKSAGRDGGLVIVGAGGFAREVHGLVKDLDRAGGAWEVLAFLGRQPDPIGTTVHGLPLLETLSDDLRGRVAAGVAAVGDPPARRREVEARADEVPAWATLVHPTVTYDPDSVLIGPGTVVCAGVSLTTDLTLGEHVILNLHCTVGHDSVLEDYVALMPGCHISGGACLHEGVYLGTGAVVLPSIEIGAGAIVGAGAVVTRDVAPGVTVAGVPARVVG